METKNHNQFVRCLENIQDLSGQGLYDYAMILGGGGMFSRKTIKYNPKTKKYRIINHIDDSKFFLTGEEILDGSIIGEAMSKRCLIALID